MIASLPRLAAGPPLRLSPYLIACGSVVPDVNTYVDRACTIAEAGFKTIQVHWPYHDIRKCVWTAMELKRRLGNHVNIIINNHVDVALAAGVGVHLAQHDFPVELARRLLGDEVPIGFTLESPAQTSLAALRLVNYVGIKVWASLRTQRQGAIPCGLPKLQATLDHLDVPAIVVGNVTTASLEQILPLLRPGDGFAVVGDVWRQENPYALAKEFVEAFSRHVEKDGAS